MKYTCTLILGIICVLLSLNWLFVIIINIVKMLIIGDADDQSKGSYMEAFQVSDYVDKLMKFILEKDLGYLANVIFICMTLYMFVAVVKGNSTLGFRFASPLFYPMRPNETQLNSFMFNILLLNACSLGIT